MGKPSLNASVPTMEIKNGKARSLSKKIHQFLGVTLGILTCVPGVSYPNFSDFFFACL